MRAADQSAGMRLARWSAALIIIGVGAAAFRLSFSTLRDLAQLANIPTEDAWLFPLIVDGTILLATFGVLVLAGAPERRFFVGVLVVGSLVSVAGNSVHAVAAGHPLPGWAAALVAAVAPISLLVDTHGLALLFRAVQRRPTPVPTAGTVEPEPGPATEPMNEPAEVSASVSDPATDTPTAESTPEPVTAALDPAPTAAPVAVVAPVRPVPVHPRPMQQEMLPIAVPVGG